MNIRETLQEIFRDMLDLDDLVLKNETSASDIEEWDSLAHVNLVVAIEREYSVNFTLSELQDLKNIGDMVELINKKVT